MEFQISFTGEEKRTAQKKQLVSTVYLKEKKNFLNTQELLVGMKEKKKKKLDNGEFFPLVSPNTEMKYFAIIKEKAKMNIYNIPHHITL